MGSTDHHQTPTRRRLPSWATTVVALLSAAVLLFWIFVFVDGLRRSTGWELGRPLLFLVGALLVSLGVTGSGVAARLAWVRPSRSKLMILPATLGLVATCIGGSMTVSSFWFFHMPGVEIEQEHERPGVEIEQEQESSVRSSDAVATPQEA